jgi:hypothetical protein
MSISEDEYRKAASQADAERIRRFEESINAVPDRELKPQAVYRLIQMDSRFVIAEVSHDPTEVLLEAWMGADVAYALVTLMGRHTDEFIELRQSKRVAF